MSEPSHPLKLTGEGYEIALSPESTKDKEALISRCSSLTAISTDQDAETVRLAIRDLVSYRNKVDASRQIVKAPILAAGRKIDEFAREICSDILDQEDRLKPLLIGYTTEKEKQAQLAEAEALRQRQEADRIQREAEEAARIAEEARSKVNVAEAVGNKPSSLQEIAARAREIDAADEAERKAQDLQASSSASADLSRALSGVASASRAGGVKGVRKVDVVTVNDPAALYKAFPGFVELRVKQGDLQAYVKGLRASGQPVEIPGVTVTQESRA